MKALDVIFGEDENTLITKNNIYVADNKKNGCIGCEFRKGHECDVFHMKCIAIIRKDGRNIVWKLKENQLY